MKFAVISDTHVHPWSAFATGTGLDNDRMQRTLGVLEEALEWSRMQSGVLVHAGDWIHTTGHARHAVTSALWGLLDVYADIHVVTVWGNHDSRGRGGVVTLDESFLRPFADLPNFHILNGEPWDYNGLYFTGLGAQPDPALLDLEMDHAAHVCILHAMVTGASFPSGTVAKGLDPDVLLANWPLTIVGDIHQPHVHEENGSTILIPGSPEHHNFGDKGPRGWWVADVDPATGAVDLDFRESSSPQFLTVNSAEDVADDGNFYRITGPISGQLPNNATAIAPSPTTVEVRDVLGGASEVREVLAKWLELNPPDRAPEHYLRVGADLVSASDVSVPRLVRSQSVRLENFLSYEDSTWDLTPGVHAVLGRALNYDSNGAGKSALAEALYWCLYGKTTKGVSAADVVRWGQKEARVTYTADVEGKALVVTRTRTSTRANLTVTLDGKALEAGTNTELDAVLDGVLGVTEDLYRVLGYFSQEDVLMLSRATDAQIKDRLADLSGARAYEEGAVRGRDGAKNARLRAERAAGKVSALSEQLGGAQASVEDVRGDLDAWEGTHATRLERARAAVEEARTRSAARLDTWKARLKRADAAVKHRTVMLEDASQDVTGAAKAIAQKMATGYEAERVRLVARSQQLAGETSAKLSLDTMRDSLAGKEEELQDRQDLRRGFQAAVRAADQDLAAGRLADLQEELAKAEEGLCPTCGQALPSGDGAVARLTESVAAEEQRLESARKRKADAEQGLEDLGTDEALEEGLKLLRRAVRAREELNVVQERITGLEEKAALVQDAAEARAREQAAAQLSTDLKALGDRLGDILRVCEEEDHHNHTAVARAEEEAERVEQEANPYKEPLAKEEARVLDIRRRRWSAHRECRSAEREAEVLEYWVGALGKSGIQSVLMDQLAAHFNACRGRVIPSLTRGVYDVQFATTSQTAKGELRERVEFQVYERGRRIPYANLSGGQRRRVDLGVLLTMTMAASQSYGIRGMLGLMILDEVASFLDADGAEALAETLAEYAGEDGVVDSVWVMSQESMLQSLFASTLLVEQDEGGVSRIT